jgi:hypothetical protein
MYGNPWAADPSYPDRKEIAMVLAAALISFAVLFPQAAAQAAPQAASQAKPQAERQPASADDSKPYTVEGVRRATAAGDRPSIDAAAVVPDRRGYRVVIDSRAINPDRCSLVITACQPAWGGGANPTWHEQFIAMTGPSAYSVPYSGMSNSQKLQAVASSAAINLALQTVVSLIYDQVVRTRYERKQQKIENIRAGIRSELDELERVNAAARGAGQTGVK